MPRQRRARLRGVELNADLACGPADIQSVAAEWDAVAAQARLPLMSSTQISAWWKHLASREAEPRIVLVRDGTRLIGVAPFYERRRNGGMLRVYALPGAEVGAGISLVSLPGRQWEVAAAVSRTLAGIASAPDVIDFRRTPLGLSWPMMLRASWPTAIPPRISQHNLELVPGIELGKRSFEEWVQARSTNLRSQLRRAMRSFERDGGQARLSSADRIEQDAAAMMSLHLRRMGRDRSSLAIMADQLVSALVEAGATSAAEGQFRLWMLEIDGAVISAQWFAACGGHVSYINGGWDPDFRRYSPALLGITHAIKDACERGDDYVDLGPGTHGYKLRLANRTDAVAHIRLLVTNRRLATTVAQTAPGLIYESIRDTAKRVLSPQHLDALRGLQRAARYARTKPAGR